MHFPITKSSRGDIQKHFKRKRVPYSEDGLIGVLESPISSRMDVWLATIGLRDVGTAKCIPFLKDKLHYPMQDVKDCSILTIAHISGAAETEFYIGAYKDKRTRKAYPIWAIQVAADQRAVDIMLEYAEDALKKIRRGADARDWLQVIEYLGRFAESDSRIPVLFGKYVIYWNKIGSDWPEELRKRIPWFEKHASGTA